MNEQITNSRDLAIFDTLREAWRLMKGSKLAILVPLLVPMIFFLVPTMINVIFTSSSITTIFTAFCYVVGMFLFLGIIAGIIKISIERARGNAVSISMGFRSFSRMIPLLLTVILFGVLSQLPSLIMLMLKIEPTAIVAPLILIYVLLVTTFLYLSMLLAVDKTNNPFTAISRSFNVIRPHWLKVLGIIVITEVIGFMIGMLIGFAEGFFNVPEIVGNVLMCIAIIWYVPFMLLVQGLVYHKLID